MAAQGGGDVEQVLRERFHLSNEEVAQARNGTPIAKLLAGAERAELGIVGTVRLPGDKARLAGWIRTIEQFRGAAEIGTSKAIALPPTAASFQGVVLDATDLADLRHCRADACAVRIPSDALARLQREVQWDTAAAAGQASTIFREMLRGYAAAYSAGGNAALEDHGGSDFRRLLTRAVTLDSLAPELVTYLRDYPAATLRGGDQCLYWSTTATDSAQVISLHHLVVYPRSADEIVIVDRIVYASRYFDAGALVISLRDAPGGGFYAIAGGRVLAPPLSGVAATVLRRQVERAALDSLRTYLTWMRDSLALPPGSGG